MKQVAPSGTLHIEFKKDPEEPGIVTYKARVNVGDETKGLGSLSFDEDELAARGHEAVRAEVEAWAKAQAAKKGIPL